MLLEACSGWFAFEFVLKALQTTDHKNLPLKHILAMDSSKQVISTI